MHNTKYSYKIDITKDRMEAYITIKEDLNGEMLNQEKVLNIIKGYNINYGINYDNIMNLCNEHIVGKRYLVAQGIKPVNGKDGKIDFFVDLDKNFEPKVLDDGRVDYKDLQIFKNVKKDQILAKKTKPEIGKDGKNIFGEVIKAKDGRDVKLPIGKNTYIKDDSLYSSIDGHITKKNVGIDVTPLIEVKDVDTSTGNIKTFASLKIYKNISSGFTIESEGDIEIYGVVEGSTIVAKGNIIIHRGIQGNGKAKITSGGNIISKYIQNCDIVAEGDITCEAIIYSNVKSNRSVKLIGNKGLIVGSVVIATKEIHAINVGSKMYAQTELKVGISPEKRKRKEEIIKKIKENKKSIDDLNKIILYLEKNGIPEDKKNIYEKSLLSLSKLNFDNKQLYEEYEELNLITKDETYGIIKVLDTVYPGTKITIDDVSQKIKEPIKYVTFIKDEADIKILPYG